MLKQDLLDDLDLWGSEEARAAQAKVDQLARDALATTETPFESDLDTQVSRHLDLKLRRADYIKRHPELLNGVGFDTVKNIARTKPYTPKYDVKTELANLNMALSKAPVYDGPLYRGMGLRPDTLGEMLSSGVFTLPHHSSAAIDPEVAKRFAAGVVGKMGGDAQKVFISFDRQQNARDLQHGTPAA